MKKVLCILSILWLAMAAEAGAADKAPGGLTAEAAMGQGYGQTRAPYQEAPASPAAPVVAPAPEPSPPQGYQFHGPDARRGRDASHQPTRLTTGRSAAPAAAVPGPTPTPGWEPAPGQSPAPAAAEPDPAEKGRGYHPPAPRTEEADAAPAHPRRRQASPSSTRLTVDAPAPPQAPSYRSTTPSPGPQIQARTPAHPRNRKDTEAPSPTRLTVPSAPQGPGWDAVPTAPVPAKTRGRGFQPPSMSSEYPISVPAHPRNRKAEPAPTRLTSGRQQPPAPAATVPGPTPTPGWEPAPGQGPAPVAVAEPSPAQKGRRGYQPPVPSSESAVVTPVHPRRRKAESAPTRLTSGRQQPAVAAAPAPGPTPTPGWEPEPGRVQAARPSAEPEPQASAPRGYQFHSPARGRNEAQAPTRLTGGGATPAPAAPPDNRSAAERRRDEKRAQAAVASPENIPAGEDAELSVPRGRDAARTQQTRLATRDKVLVPATGVAPAVLADEMVQAYHLFDSRYKSALGKTRKELADMWGFPLETMGKQDGELAVGFRQRGTIIKPEVRSGATRNVSYYASTNTAQAPTAEANVTPFSCLVVFWIDQEGEGRVVNGDAVGDCFVVESLRNVPVKYER